MNAVQSRSSDPITFDPVLTAEHEGMFRHFLGGMLFATAHVLQFVALLTVAFAIGAGWWAGLAAFVAIGVAIGLAFKRGPIYWAIFGAETVAMIVGGLLVGVFAL